MMNAVAPSLVRPKQRSSVGAVYSEGARLLAAYIAGRGLFAKEFAAMLRVKPPRVSQLLHGESLPSLEVAIRIEKLTAGEIPCRLWGERARTEEVALGATRDDGAACAEGALEETEVNDAESEEQ
jgi:DNA-binding transcriptional regulator YdaS (Cro superfamily)